MGIREIINKTLPTQIPDFSYLDEYDQLQTRIYYGFIPEDEENTPAMAYVIENQAELRDLEGVVYAQSATVRFGIVSDSLETLDNVKNKMLNLCGRGKLPGVQVVEYVDGGDADADLVLQHNLTGIEIALTFHF